VVAETEWNRGFEPSNMNLQISPAIPAPGVNQRVGTAVQRPVAVRPTAQQQGNVRLSNTRAATTASGVKAITRDHLIQSTSRTPPSNPVIHSPVQQYLQVQQLDSIASLSAMLGIDVRV